MEPKRVEFQKQCIFQSFCKRELHNETCNAHDEIRRHRAKEVTSSDLALHEERQLYTLDKYFKGKKPSRAINRQERKSRRSCCLTQSARCRRKREKPYSCTILRA